MTTIKIEPSARRVSISIFDRVGGTWQLSGIVAVPPGTPQLIVIDPTRKVEIQEHEPSVMEAARVPEPTFDEDGGVHLAEGVNID